MTADTALQELLRPLVPKVLGALARRYGGFEACEDAVQEALLAAAVQWPGQGLPGDPQGWLLTVASRRLADQQRSDLARRRREAAVASLVLADRLREPGPDADRPEDHDDSLTLVFLCCHPVLAPRAQAEVTLRAVGGLSTAEIARAFLTSEATMARRISRSKQRITASGVPFALPPRAERAARLRVVLHVLYLIFNEGYLTTSGPGLQRGDLTAEAIRLTRQVRRLQPADGEVTGLLALMLLTQARQAARTGPDGILVPLGEQDRGRWDHTAVHEGLALVEATLPLGPAGPYLLQAAIAAVHAEAPSAQDTDWPQILALYEMLHHILPSPVVALNRAVAVAMACGPRAGLDLLDDLAADKRLASQHQLDAVRAHLLDMAGDHARAAASYRQAAERAISPPERSYLHRRAERLVPQAE